MSDAPLGAILLDLDNDESLSQARAAQWRARREPSQTKVSRSKRGQLKLQAARAELAEAHRQAERMRQIAASSYVRAAQAIDPDSSCITLDARGHVAPAPRDVPSELSRHVRSLDPICRYCMEQPSTTVDHVWPCYYGGCSHLHNLVGACEPCNLRKGRMFVCEAGMVLHVPQRYLYATRWAVR